MPTIPQTQNLNYNSLQILNLIRSTASASYQERIPDANPQNLPAIGEVMLTYQATANEFIDALMNRIARVMVTSKLYDNPLKPFKKGVIGFGETIEEVFVQIAKAHEYDPEEAETTLYKRTLPDVQSAFHKLNKKLYYPVTISNEQLRTAFLSEQGVTDLISKIVESAYSGAEVDEYLIMKQLVADAIINGRMYPVNIPTVNAANAKSIVSKIKGISNKLEFPSNKYNYLNVITHSKKPEQIILLDAEFDAVIDVEVLASAFNMNKAEFMGQRVLLDDFADATGVVAALVDRDFYMVFDNLRNFAENYNGKGLYWNYFYHVWSTYSTSPFANAVFFTTDTVAITSVVFDTPPESVAKGSRTLLKYTVNGTGYFPKDVSFKVEGELPLASGTYINQTGELVISSLETNDEISVEIKSVFDPTKSSVITIEIV